jgi:hypothetical protein
VELDPRIAQLAEVTKATKATKDGGSAPTGT